MTHALLAAQLMSRYSTGEREEGRQGWGRRWLEKVGWPWVWQRWLAPAAWCELSSGAAEKKRFGEEIE